MITDPISDLMTRVRNAQSAGHHNVRVLFSKMAARVLEVLKSEGFIDDFEERSEEGTVRRYLLVHLKYVAPGEPLIKRLERVSKSGKRVYRKNGDIPKIDCGLGTAIISTSQGVMSDREARRRKVGGEIVGYVA